MKLHVMDINICENKKIDQDLIALLHQKFLPEFSPSQSIFSQNSQSSLSLTKKYYFSLISRLLATLWELRGHWAHFGN